MPANNEAGITLQSLNALPDGAKVWLLDLGHMTMDASFMLSGVNIATPAKPTITHELREIVMISALIYHPTVGLILYDVGSAEDIIKNWDPYFVECCPRYWVKGVHDLPSAIKATGNDIKDVKAVVMSHLHMDHAGGLENFLDTDIPIYVHEAELKYAFWTSATNKEPGLYPSSYMTVDRLNWRTYHPDIFELFPGITMHRVPGHTDGSVALEMTLRNSGTILFTGDSHHVRENWEEGRPQGALLRDFERWLRSHEYLRNLAMRKGAKVVLGHEMLYFESVKAGGKFLD